MSRSCALNDYVSFLFLDVVYNELSDGVKYVGVNKSMSIFTVSNVLLMSSATVVVGCGWSQLQ